MSKENLLKVAKALRESTNPDLFEMGSYSHPCGTPACALGHYAARRDLQDFLKIDGAGLFYVPELRVQVGFTRADYDDEYVCGHFGISTEEAEELFSTFGCNAAKTATQAAEYIERFAETRD
jgi:hypothetical protein